VDAQARLSHQIAEFEQEKAAIHQEWQAKLETLQQAHKVSRVGGCLSLWRPTHGLVWEL
jgi:hypothetical protein